MSEKMMARVSAADDEQPHAPIGVDEATFNQLQLRDLEAQDVDNRVLLNIPDQQKFFSHDKSQEQSSLVVRDPLRVISSIRRQAAATPKLQIDFDDHDKASAATATSSVMKSIRQRLALLSSPSEADTGLAQSRIDAATMTHNTTIEFLHYFWNVYQSGDDSRAIELAKLVETLSKSRERIAAVAADAEKERQDKLKEQKQKAEEYHRRTGKRMRLNPREAGGGKEAVERMLVSTEQAIKYAGEEYQRAYQEQLQSSRQD
jgi:transcription initiation factor TFIIH subunit 1